MTISEKEGDLHLNPLYERGQNVSDKHFRKGGTASNPKEKSDVENLKREGIGES